MRILVVGAGMYVSGRGSSDFGTVLPALAQMSRDFPIAGVTVCATRASGEVPIATTAAAINSRLNSTLAVDYAVAADFLSDRACLAEYDCAIVAVPDHLHFEIGKQVLSAGLHCLMVKPLAPTVHEAKELVRIQKAQNLLGVVELHKRYDQQNLLVRRLLGEGTLGLLSYATVDFSQRVEIPTRVFRNWCEKTNVFQYLGVHYADMLWFLTGYRPIRAMAVGNRGVLAKQGLDALDSVLATILWQYPNDPERRFSSQFAVNWIDSQHSTAMSEQKYTLVGEHGRIECDQKNRGLLVVGQAGAQSINPYFSQYLHAPEGMQFAGYGPQSIMEFVRDVGAIVDGRKVPEDFEPIRSTFSQALVSTAVVEAVSRSLRDGFGWKDVDAPT